MKTWKGGGYRSEVQRQAAKERVPRAMTVTCNTKRPTSPHKAEQTGPSIYKYRGATISKTAPGHPFGPWVAAIGDGVEMTAKTKKMAMLIVDDSIDRPGQLILRNLGA